VNEKMLNEGNQIHILYPSSGSGSDFLTSYDSGSGSGGPQRCCQHFCRTGNMLSENSRLSKGTALKTCREFNHFTDPN
jgi:hypothetical protein